MAWQIEFDPEAVKDLKKLDRTVQQRILGFLKTRIAPCRDPRAIGEALAGSKLGNYWKYRVDDWRLVCDIGDQKITVRVLRVSNRSEIYKR